MLGGLLLASRNSSFRATSARPGKDAIAFAILILILLVKPTACWGAASLRRFSVPGLYGGSALQRTGRAVRSWHRSRGGPVAGRDRATRVGSRLEYLFVNLNHIGVAVILAVSLNLVNGLTASSPSATPGFMAVGGYVSPSC